MPKLHSLYAGLRLMWRSLGGIFTKKQKQWWLPELFASCCAILASLGLVFLFYHFNGSKVPQWQLAITLSSIASILSQVLEYFLAKLLQATLQSLKLLWFTRPRLLRHLQIFDSAAHGPLGLPPLLWLQRLNGRACFVGILLLLRYGIGPSVQQALTAVVIQSPSGSATIPRTLLFDKINPGQNPQVGNVDSSIRTAIINGLNNNDISIFKAPVHCPTGNCTWDAFPSLGVNFICKSLDDQILSDCDTVDNCTYTVPILDSAPLIVNTLSDTLVAVPLLNSSTFPDYPQELINVKVLGTPGINNVPASALTCSLYLVGNIYQSSSINGIIQETIKATYHNSTMAWPDESWTIQAPQPPNSPTILNFSSLAIYATQLYLSQYFFGVEMEGTSSSADSIAVLASGFRSGILPQLFGNIAVMLTTALRASGYTPGTTEPGPSAAGGIAYATDYIVEIRWPWLVLPLALPWFATVLFFLTLWPMHRQGIARVDEGVSVWMWMAPADWSRAELRIRVGADDLEAAGGAEFIYRNGRFEITP